MGDQGKNEIVELWKFSLKIGVFLIILGQFFLCAEGNSQKFGLPYFLVYLTQCFLSFIFCVSLYYVA